MLVIIFISEKLRLSSTISISKVHLNVMFHALQLKCHFACLPYLIYALLIVQNLQREILGKLKIGN